MSEPMTDCQRRIMQRIMEGGSSADRKLAMRDCLAEIDRLTAENAQLREDAERWKRLCDGTTMREWIGEEPTQ